MRKSPITAYTDYPFVELGDNPESMASMRHVVVIDNDGDKYSTVIIEGVVLSVKSGYLYEDRSDRRSVIPRASLPRLAFYVPCWKGPKCST